MIQFVATGQSSGVPVYITQTSNCRILLDVMDSAGTRFLPAGSTYNYIYYLSNVGTDGSGNPQSNAAVTNEGSSAVNKRLWIKPALTGGTKRADNSLIIAVSNYAADGNISGTRFRIAPNQIQYNVLVECIGIYSTTLTKTLTMGISYKYNNDSSWSDSSIIGSNAAKLGTYTSGSTTRNVYACTYNIRLAGRSTSDVWWVSPYLRTHESAGMNGISWESLYIGIGPNG